MKENKFNTWNNSPCRTIFYHVTQGSHRAALYCFYNFSEHFSDELVKRILNFIYAYLRTSYRYKSAIPDLSYDTVYTFCLDHVSRSHMYNELNNFYECLISNNDVDSAVSSFIHQSILKYYAKK